MKYHGIETRAIEGENHPLYGQERTEETKRKISTTLTDRELSAETRARMSRTRTGRTLPAEIRRRISSSLTGTVRSEATRRKMSESTAGANNPNWRGGYSRRYGSGWSAARRRIRAREKTCRHCAHDGSERRLEVIISSQYGVFARQTARSCPTRIGRVISYSSVDGATSEPNTD